MKYTFEIGTPYRRDSAFHHQARCGTDIYRNDPGAEQLSVAPYVTVNGRVTPVAKYRADRVAAGAHRHPEHDPERHQATGLAGGEAGLSWELLVSLVRSVLDNVSTVEMEHPDPLSNFL